MPSTSSSRTEEAPGSERNRVHVWRSPARNTPLILPMGSTDRRGAPSSGATADHWWIGWVSPSGARSVRIINVVVAAVGILITAPLMLLIALAVRITSPGPAIYTQQRVGLDTRMGIDRRKDRRVPTGTKDRRSRDKGGRLFTIYKFRTMANDTSGRGQIWARPGDPRITRVGAILRRYRLDELPQLFNVLRGDMNIVGPRPEQPEIFESLRDEVYGYAYRQRVLPGITGWAQVNHHYDQNLEDVRKKVHLDLEYIRRRSAIHDLKIMARTVPVMIGKKGSV
jgi:lipopolysaccharide/colanic/teichoic acid biosynthesis glycosyltransferase